VWDLFLCAKYLFVEAIVGEPASAQTELSPASLLLLRLALASYRFSS
jgi:hypothetical protein